MSTILHLSGDNFDGLTKVETDGTVVIDNGAFLFSTKAGTSASTLGFYTDESYGPIAAGWVVYFQIMPIGPNNIVGALSLKSGAGLPLGSSDYNTVEAGSNRDQARAYYSNTSGGVWTASNAGNDTIPDDEWTDIKMAYTDADGQIDFFRRPSDDPGNFNPNSSAWIEWAAGSRYSIGANIIGNSIRLSVSKTSDIGTMKFDEIYITNDGEIGPEDNGDSAPELFIVEPMY